MVIIIIIIRVTVTVTITVIPFRPFTIFPFFLLKEKKALFSPFVFCFCFPKALGSGLDNQQEYSTQIRLRCAAVGSCCVFLFIFSFEPNNRKIPENEKKISLFAISNRSICGGATIWRWEWLLACLQFFRILNTFSFPFRFGLVFLKSQNSRSLRGHHIMYTAYSYGHIWKMRKNFFFLKGKEKESNTSHHYQHRHQRHSHRHHPVFFKTRIIMEWHGIGSFQLFSKYVHTAFSSLLFHSSLLCSKCIKVISPRDFVNRPLLFSRK